ncbi:MAG: ribosome maturation factor RimP [Thermodesulfobacteriota bacterium]|nr:ribosome maturation factor RimP [Thermodesulfobacteriota bacterium]
MNELANRICHEVEVLAEPLLKSEGFTLIDVEYRSEPKGRTLRLIVDREGGVTLGDCADISHQLGDLLDAKADFLGAYHMEISSPGLDRPLTKPRHFVHFKGRPVAVKTSAPIGGKRDFRGLLDGLFDGMVVVQGDGEVYSIPWEAIVKARLDY